MDKIAQQKLFDEIISNLVEAIEALENQDMKTPAQAIIDRGQARRLRSCQSRLDKLKLG